MDSIKVFRIKGGKLYVRVKGWNYMVWMIRDIKGDHLKSDKKGQQQVQIKRPNNVRLNTICDAKQNKTVY